jgi:hypothetical protein
VVEVGKPSDKATLKPLLHCEGVENEQLGASAVNTPLSNVVVVVAETLPFRVVVVDFSKALATPVEAPYPHIGPAICG